MLKTILNWVFPQGRTDWDTLTEGLWADEYSDSTVRDQIKTQYLQRHPAYRRPTPLTHPELFDPLRPPQGWRYDPYYETWFKFGE